MGQSNYSKLILEKLTVIVHFRDLEMNSKPKLLLIKLKQTKYSFEYHSSLQFNVEKKSFLLWDTLQKTVISSGWSLSETFFFNFRSYLFMLLSHFSGCNK